MMSLYYNLKKGKSLKTLKDTYLHMRIELIPDVYMSTQSIEFFT